MSGECDHEDELKRYRSDLLQCFNNNLSSMSFEEFSRLCLHTSASTIWAYRALPYFLPFFMESLQYSLPINTSNEFQSWDWASLSRAMNIPLPDQIPFQDMMRLPLPFTNGSDGWFHQCHLPHMTSKSFLEDGEWVGCKSFSVLPWYLKHWLTGHVTLQATLSIVKCQHLLRSLTHRYTVSKSQ